MLEAVLEVTFAAGRLVDEVTAGRAGGLLSPPLGAAREVEVAVGLVLLVGLEVVGRFEVFIGRFGGTAFR